MAWPDSYIGIPYAELNCAQLVATVLADQFGKHATAVEMMGYPQHQDGTSARCDAIRNHAGDHAATRSAGREEDGDGVVLAAGGRLRHIGLLHKRNGRNFILHTTRETGAVLEPVERVAAKYRIVAFYEWHE